MLKEFREFAFKGSLLDLAIGLILGVAFGKVIASLVTDVIMPPIGLLLGRVDFANLFINLSDKPYATLAAAKAAGAPAIAFGAFLNTIINFVVVAIVLFLIIRPFNRAKEEAEAGEGPEEAKDSIKDALDDKGKGKGEGAEGSQASGSEGDTGTASD
jgi:large conductance mechanosensitive channel